MVAIVAGNGLGLNLTSGLILGSSGVLGSAGLGRGNDRAYVNAATGNLVIQSRDDLLIGRGHDVNSLRTYNSQGKLNDDNGDNWLTSFARRISGLTGIANTAGSTVTRTDEDGGESVFSWDASRTAYVSKSGAGAFDTLTYNTTSKLWTFVDGSSQSKETYEVVSATPQWWRLKTHSDTDGNALTLAYGANNLVSSITTANGEVTLYDYNTNKQLTKIRTQYKSSESATANDRTLTRVAYGYDAAGRLETVTVDLSPEDNATLDGKTLVTTYTYDGTSKRVASISQSDGSYVGLTYELVGADYRVKTLTQTVQSGESRLTSFSYDTVNRKTTVTDALNNQTVLSYDAAGQLLSVEAPPATAGAALRSVCV